MSHRQYQQEPHQQTPERNGHSHQGIMDLRNLCQRLDVDHLKGLHLMSISTEIHRKEPAHMANANC